MSQPLHTIERAYQIAKSGECVGVEAIRRRLKDEHYVGVDAHLAGAQIKRDLTSLMKSAALACELQSGSAITGSAASNG